MRRSTERMRFSLGSCIINRNTLIFFVFILLIPAVYFFGFAQRQQAPATEYTFFGRSSSGFTPSTTKTLDQGSTLRSFQGLVQGSAQNLIEGFSQGSSSGSDDLGPFGCDIMSRLHMFSTSGSMVAEYNLQRKSFIDFEKIARLFRMESLINAHLSFDLGLEKYEFGAYAWNSSFVMNSPRKVWVEPPLELKQRSCEINISGLVYEYHSWFANNYGHFLHDHLPVIYELKQRMPPNSRLLLYKADLQINFFRWFDPEFESRIIWITKGAVVCVTGELMVVSPQERSSPVRLPGLSASLPEWISKHERDTGMLDALPASVVYYSRLCADVHHGRSFSATREAAIVDRIRKAMKRYDRKEQLVIFNGMEGNETMSFENQYRTFRSAHVIIGPHGSGMANMLWARKTPDCDSRAKVIEFLCGPGSPTVQPRGCPFGKTYWRLFALAPWVEYHHIIYSNDSTIERLDIHMADLDLALHSIWSNDSDYMAGSESRYESTRPHKDASLMRPVPPMESHELCDASPTLHTLSVEEVPDYTQKLNAIRNQQTNASFELFPLYNGRVLYNVFAERNQSALAWNDTLVLDVPLMWLPPIMQQRENSQCDVVLNGPVFEYHSWFSGDYGHFLHDHLPIINWLRLQIVSSGAKLLLKRSELAVELMKWFDSEFEKCIVWTSPMSTACVNGWLWVLVRQDVHEDFALPIRQPHLMNLLPDWIDEHVEASGTSVANAQSSWDVNRRAPTTSDSPLSFASASLSSWGHYPCEAMSRWLSIPNITRLTSDDPLVIVAGEGTTGTHTVAKMLVKEGYHAGHWNAYHTGKRWVKAADEMDPEDQGYSERQRYVQNWNRLMRMLPEERDSFDFRIWDDWPRLALSDEPIPQYFPYIFRSYPRAKVILTLREPYKWVLRRNEKHPNSPRPFGFLDRAVDDIEHDRNNTDRKPQPLNSLGSALMYELHNMMVMCMVPPEQLLVVNLFDMSDDEVSQRLRDFLEDILVSDRPSSPGFLQPVVPSPLSSSPVMGSPTQETVVFYSPKSGSGFSQSHERVVVQTIENAMERYGRREQLVVFTGIEDGRTMSYDYQFHLFRSATTAIGPHGSGFANVLWMRRTSDCSRRPKVVEFICGKRSRGVQPGCSYSKTYWQLHATIPWVEYHHMLFASNSTKEELWLDLTELDASLDAVWG